jgi:pyrroline-5-carboxylate reductase
MTFGSIGAGHMGSSILRAVLDSGLYIPEMIHISSPVNSELEPFAAAGCVTGTDNLLTAVSSDLIMLAVRPGQVKDVLDEIAPAMDGKCLISIAAGVTVSSIRSSLPSGAHVIRVMPNLPVAYKLGAAVMASPEGVPRRFAEAAEAVFKSGGTVEVMDEDLINAATALGGSAVAYFFRMAEVMSDWALQNGISPEAALRITAQTMRGAAEMLTVSGKRPGELADGVAVPGGMTEAAFRAFDRLGFDEALRAGMEDCKTRGIELVSLS